jgi:nicotinate-nucleotide pyrophosphorylase (carboxylating)
MVDYLLREKLSSILKEDLAYGDITTELLIEPKTVEAVVISRSEGVAAGMQVARELLEMVGITVLEALKDGQTIDEDQSILRMRGINRSILMIERTLLNILARMGGIASITAEYIQRAKQVNPDVRIAATRKTAPGLRWLDKMAVTIGGGDTHRIALHDMVLIKDNHIDAMGDLARAITRAKSKASFVRKIEVEVSSSEDAMTAIENGADLVMLDNMSIDDMNSTMKILEERGYREKAMVEASGNVDMENIADVVAIGVDVVSIGSLTHSVKALDLTLEFDKS